MNRLLALYAASSALALSSGCVQKTEAPAAAASAPAAESSFQLTASIQELMLSEVDASADVLWNSVGSISSAKGIEERRPRTDEEWQTVRNAAITLAEATNLLVMEGRKVAPASGKIQDQGAPGNLSPEEIQKAIDSDRAAFGARAHVLTAAALQALKAIDAKDADALLEAGDVIDQACEACHVKYWYPNSIPPGYGASAPEAASGTKAN